MSISNESQQKEEIDPSAEMAQNDQDRETRSEQEGWVFDEKQKHYPVFFLTDIPGDVRLRLFLRSKVLSLQMLIRSDSITQRCIAASSMILRHWSPYLLIHLRTSSRI